MCCCRGDIFLGVYLLGQLYRIIKLHQLYQIMSQCFSRVSVVPEHCQESCTSFNCSTAIFYTYYCHFYSTPANLVTQYSFNLYTSRTNEIKHYFLCFWYFLFLFGLKIFDYFPLGCLDHWFEHVYFFFLTYLLDTNHSTVVCDANLSIYDLSFSFFKIIFLGTHKY